MEGISERLPTHTHKILNELNESRLLERDSS
jgi:hypothetical protein